MSNDLYDRIREMPVMDRYDWRVPAALFNLWRRYWIHHHHRLRIEIEGYEPMAMILDERFWACVDTSLFDAPVVVWMEFEDQGRSSLHEPVPCVMRHYHQGASVIRNAGMEAAEKHLQSLLKADEHGRVAPLR